MDACCRQFQMRNINEKEATVVELVYEEVSTQLQLTF